MSDRDAPDDRAAIGATEVAPPGAEPGFIREAVRRRAWPLIIALGTFGLLLAVAPFLFFLERSPYSDALGAYDRLCRAAAAGDPVAFRADMLQRHAALPDEAVVAAMGRLPCVERRLHDARFDPVKDRWYGPDRAWVLTLTPRAGGAPVRIRFQAEDDVVRWDPAAE